MKRPTRSVRSALLGGLCLVLSGGCGRADPWARLVTYEQEKGACIDRIQSRLTTALGRSPLPVDLGEAMGDVIGRLPEQEGRALQRAGEFFLTASRNRHITGDDSERNLYWSALYEGFEAAPVCSWSKRSTTAYVEAAVFVDTLGALLLARGVDTGSPALAHTDLVVALVRAAAGADSHPPLSGPHHGPT